MKTLSQYSNANKKYESTIDRESPISSALKALEEKKKIKEENKVEINTELQTQEYEKLKSEIQARRDVEVENFWNDRKNQINVSLVGGTGDSLVIDNTGNIAKDYQKDNDLDLQNKISSVNQKEVETLMNNREKYIASLGEENFNNLVIELGGDPTPPDLKVDFEYGKLSLESSLAWNQYLNTGNYLDLAKAKSKDSEIEEFVKKNNYKLDNSALSGSAEYLPQFVYYLKANAPAMLAGLITTGTIIVGGGVFGGVAGAGASGGVGAVPRCYGWC